MPALLLLSLAMAMEVLPIILMEAAATHTEAHRVCMDTMVAMDMDMAMARGLLKLSLDMVVLLTIPMVAAALYTEPHRA